MTELLDARRGFVPSEREVEAGGDAAFVPAPEPEPRPRRSLRGLVAIPLSQLNIREIAGDGPLLPVLLMFALLSFGTWDDAAFSVLLPDIRKDLGFDLGFAIVVSQLVLIIAELIGPLTGYLADRVSRVRMIAIGGVLANVSSIGLGAASGPATIALARAAAGGGQSAITPAALPLVADWYPLERRGRVMSWLFTGSLIGLFIGPVVAGALGTWWGWRATVASLGALATLVAMPFFFLREPVRGASDRKALGADQSVVETPQKPTSWSEGWRAAGSIATLRRTWFATPFLTAGSSSINGLIAFYYRDEFGLSSLQLGLVGGVTGGAGVLGLLFAGPISDRLIATRPGRVYTLLGAVFALNAGSMVLLAISPSPWLSVLVSLPIAVVGGLVLPAQITLTSLVVPARIRGFGLQTLAPWRVLGYLMVALIGLIAHTSSVRGALLLFAPLYLIGAVITSSAAGGVERDMRAATAAALADEEARRARNAGQAKLLVCRDVDVTYAGTRVLFHVDLDVEDGELVALLGTNGAGKSTLLRAAAGLQPASNGAIFLDGEDITHRPPHEIARLGVVFMPGGQAVFPSLTVAENLTAAAWLHHDDQEGVRRQTDEVLDLFPELRPRLGDKAGTLSGGEQQMVALGQSFLMRPRLLMIDELSLGLAPAVVERLLEIVKRTNEQGTTIVLVEQSVNVALAIAKRAVFLDKGEVRFDGSVRDLIGRNDLVRSVFLGGAGTSGKGFIASSTGLRRPERDTPPEVQLHVEDLHLKYGGRSVLNGVSFAVSSGEVLGIIGPNGAGKTSLFDAVSGYAKPHQGSVLVGSADATRLGPDARARLGLARSFQSARLFSSLTVRENIAVALEQKLAVRSAVSAALWLPKVRRSEQRGRRRVEYLVDLLSLEAYGDKFVGELSTGSRRMVDMACILAAEPSVLLLDEPSSGLSQAEVEALGPLVRRLARETNCAVVVIEHDIPLVTALSDRMLAMVLGHIVAEGTPDDVISDPVVISAYLGASQTALGRSGDLTHDALQAAGLLPD